MSTLRILAAVLGAAALGWAGGVWLGAGRGIAVEPPVGDAAPPAGVVADTTEAAPEAPVADRPEPAGKAATPAGAGAQLGIAEVEALLGSLPARDRDGWLADAEALGRLVEEESALRSVLAAAAASRALDDPLTALLVQRAHDRTLADLYLARVVRANLSPDFPSAGDVEQFIREQPERFRWPERVPVWQVFLPVAADAGPESVAAAASRAEELASALRKDKADFADVAFEHSGHAASRAAGGFMGLLAVQDLLPEVRERIGRLEVGKVSEPVRTTQGFHILKVGARQPARELPAGEARTLAHQELLREATAAIHEAAVDRIRKEYPVRMIDGDIDAWHQRLLSRDWSDGTGTAPGAGGDEPMQPAASTAADAHARTEETPR